MIKNYSENETKEIFNKYLTTDCTITQIYETYGWNLKNLFKKYNLTERKTRNGRYKLNWNAESISNEIEAYFIGFMYADGYISGNNQAAIKLKNQESEVILLNLLKEYIIPEQSLKYERNNTSVKLLISSNEFVNNLQELGVLKQKTYKELFIPKMDKTLLRHFVRGYFDADGTVYYDRKYLKSNICSINHAFLLLIQEILIDYGIETKINVEIREGKKLLSPQGDYKDTYKNMYRLNIVSKDLKIKFRDFLYKDSKIFLNRKKDIFFKENTEVN